MEIRNVKNASVKTLKQAVVIFEEVARFHILCINEGRQFEGFEVDYEDNHKELTSTLTTLMEIYSLSRQKIHDIIHSHPNTSYSSIENICFLSPNEADFTAYYLVFMLENPTKFAKTYQNIPKDLLNSHVIKQAKSMVRAYFSNNVAEMGFLIDTADYFLASCVSWFMKDIRKRVLDMFKVAFSNMGESKDISIEFFKDLFFYNNKQEALNSLLAYGMNQT